MIESGAIKVTFSGDGKTTAFPYSFAVNSAADIHVAIHDSSTGDTVELSSDFYVDTLAKMVHYPGYAPGQEPAMAERPAIIPNGYTVTIFRQTHVNQLTDLGSRYPLRGIEMMVDKLTMIAQEHDEQIGRSVHTDIGGTETADELMNRIETAADSAVEAAGASATSRAAAESAAEGAKASDLSAAAAASSAGLSAEEAAKIVSTSAIMYDTFIFDDGVLAPQMYAQPSQRWGVDECIFPLQI